MKLIYIANARIPTEKAHGIQIMKMCEAFSKLEVRGSRLEVELVLPQRLNWIKSDPFDYYGMTKTFKITKLPCLDLIPFHRFMGHTGLWIESMTFFCSLIIYMFFKKADIIYTRDKYAIPLSFFKKNLILETHTFPRHYNLYAPFLKRVKEIVVITRNLKDLFIEKGISQDKVLIAPDGVDLDKFEIRNPKSEIRKKLGLPQDKKIVLYAGHFYEWKGVQTLAEASQYLPEDVEVYFVGGTTEDVRKFEIRNSKFETVHVIGHRPHSEIPFWLKAADVLVLPNSGKEEISRHWTSPLKMFEYMASENPIVASNLPSIREILNEGNAILAEPDNPQRLADGVRRALQDQSFSDRISKKALEDVRLHTWSNRVRNILWKI